jgi:hypothetical protein
MRGSVRLVIASLVMGLATMSTVVLPAQDASAATDMVTTCSGDATVPGSLPYEVANAASGDTITFSVSCPPNSPIVLDSTIDITTNLTIAGPGASDMAVSGNNALEVLSVASGVTSTTISGLTIEDGNVESSGAGIQNNGTLTITDSTISGNVSEADEDNDPGFGGGIDNEGTLTVTDSTFSGNGAFGGYQGRFGSGGGIGNDGLLTVSGSTFSGNSGGGGGIFTGQGATATVTDSTLSGNNGLGGGLANYGGTLVVTDSTVSGNKGPEGAGIDNGGEHSVATITDSTVSGNTATTQGGGIWDLGKLMITSSTVSGNKGSEGGGGIYIKQGYRGRTLGRVSLAATIIANNGSGGDCSGGIVDGGYNLADDESCGLTSSTDFPDTSPGLDPAGLQNNGGPTQTIALELGSAAIGGVTSAALCSTPDQRGTVRPTPCDVGAYQTPTQVVTNCNDSGPGSLRAAVETGGSVTFSVTCPSSSPITLASTIDLSTGVSIVGPGSNNVVVSGNEAVEVFDVSSTSWISGLTIEYGDTQDGGGGIYNDGMLTLNDSIVIHNRALSGFGGGIENTGTLNVSDSTLAANSAVAGGGIYIGGTADVVNSTFFNNSASGGGGGIYNASTATITDSTFASNNAAHGGGGAIDNDGTLAVGASTLSGNTTTGAGGALLNDGGLSLAASIVANSSSGQNCSGSITDAGYNLDDDGSCGLSAVNHSQSDVDPDLGPLQDNGGPTETQAPALDSPAINQIPIGTQANGITICPGTDQRGITRPQNTACDLGAVELVLPQAITSADSAIATVGSPFSFTVTTTGNPPPSFSLRGRLPKHVAFDHSHNLHRGGVAPRTAAISGTPTTAGTYRLTISAIFGKGKKESVVTQAFTLTVNPA